MTGGATTTPMSVRAGAQTLIAVLAVALLVPATPLPAQESREGDPGARAELREGMQLAAAGDTLAALDHLARAVQLDPDLAEAHFQRGLIQARRAAANEEFEVRLDAREAFREALRRDPDNPVYLVELGKLMLKQQIKVDARRMFRRALDLADRADPKTLAEVHYQLGLFEETQWMRFRYRHLLPMNRPQVNAQFAFDDPEYVWRLLESSGFPRNQGEAEKEAMLNHYYSALRADPSHSGAASHLLAYLFDEGMMGEYMSVARSFVRAAPSDPRAYLALGMGLHARGEEDEAAGAFRYALDLMPEGKRQQVRDISRLLTADDAEEMADLSDPAEREYRRRFWIASDPLYLTPSNEFRLEYLARMTYADLRFGVPEYGLSGWETDRGLIWVRYGRPAKWATIGASSANRGDFAAVGKITTVWSYGKDGPVFLFRQNPGYRLAKFGGDFRFYAEDYRSIQPSRVTAPSVASMVEMPVQVVRFRGDGESRVDLEVHAGLPLDTLGAEAGVEEATMETGFFVLNPDGSERVRNVDSEEVAFDVGGENPGLRSWRTAVPAGRPYKVSVEAREPLSWAAAVARADVEGITFPAGEPSVSDILLATTVEPLVEEPETRPDFRIVPEPSMAFEANEPIGLYFELYNLVPDSEQFASYELELVVTVDEIYREGPVSTILGELRDLWGFTGEGGEAVQLRFEKEARVVARDAIPEYFTISLDEAPAGRYGLRLTIHDRNADREFTTTRTFEIEEPESSE